MNVVKNALTAVLLLGGGTEAFAPGRCSSLNKSHKCTVPVPVRTSALHSSSYQNDGPFGFLQQFLEIGGLTKEGKSIYFGAFTKDATNATPPEEAAQLRQTAAESLTNIGDEERARRDQAGDIMTVVSAIYILWATLIADDGGFSGHVVRMAAAMPIFLAYGYKESAKSGLCNIAQAGVWDVDGNGLSKIEDLSLAKAINEKVNKMNSETGIVFIPVAIFAALPDGQSKAIVLSAAIGAALYFLRDKIPTEVE